MNTTVSDTRQFFRSTLLAGHVSETRPNGFTYVIPEYVNPSEASFLFAEECIRLGARLHAEGKDIVNTRHIRSRNRFDGVKEFYVECETKLRLAKPAPVSVNRVPA